MLHCLLDERRLSSAEGDYLEKNLIEDYEKRVHPVEPLPPAQMLAMSIKTRGVTQTAVARATGIPVSTISELMSRKREFNLSHVEKLCADFGLNPSAFIKMAKDVGVIVS